MLARWRPLKSLAQKLHPERSAACTGGDATHTGSDDNRSGLWLPVAGSA